MESIAQIDTQLIAEKLGILLPTVPPSQILASVVEVSNLYKTWVKGSARLEIVPFLRSVRDSLARTLGGEELLRKFHSADMARSDITNNSVSVSVSEAAPLPVDVASSSLPVPVSRTGLSSLAYTDIAAEPVTATPTMSLEGSDSGNSFAFSKLAGSGLRDIAAQAQKIREAEEINVLSREIVTLLCQMAMQKEL